MGSFSLMLAILAPLAGATQFRFLQGEREEQILYQPPPVPSASSSSAPKITLSETWDTLGPFQIGTREAAWGADPLEFYGGFHSLKPSQDAIFKSSLAYNGEVKWNTTRATSVNNTESSSKVSLSVGFKQDWGFLQAVYGWPALQHQSWARGTLTVTSPKPVTALLHSTTILEYALDGHRHWGGDFYGYRRAPLVMHLIPGEHVLDVRLVRDIRSMGGLGFPFANVDLEVILVDGGVEVEVGEEKILGSDVVEGKLASPYATVSLRNSGEELVEVVGVAEADASSASGTRNSSSICLLETSEPKVIAPGQTRPIPFHISIDSSYIPTNTTSGTISKQLAIRYRTRADPSMIRSVTFTLTHDLKTKYQAHKVTHLHPGGIVSYAILRAPSATAKCPLTASNSTSSGTTAPPFKAPVMLMLHGAGVEADNPAIAGTFDPLPDLCAWVLYPSGVTPWSGDDWHKWGFQDVTSAIANIPSWITSVGWTGYGVDVNRWLASGHSNGGQGTWYTLLHWPDKVFAAAPVSGYLSIPEYVPYKFWRPTEPRKKALMEAGLNSYRHELLASNAAGIPVMQQHGEIDDNVPAYQGRLMYLMLEQARSGSAQWGAGNSSEDRGGSGYNEVAGQNHYWDGVMTTAPLAEFYEEQLTKDPNAPRSYPQRFEVVTGNPGEMGSKFGLKILHLIDPAVMGRVVATASADSRTRTWGLEFENVLAFSWSNSSLFARFTLPGMGEGMLTNESSSTEYWRKEDGSWSTSPPAAGALGIRRPEQMGGIDAILKTKGALDIVFHGNETYDVALDVARNLFQYYYADSRLIAGKDVSTTSTSKGNKITLAVGEEPPSGLKDAAFPVKVGPEGVIIKQGAKTFLDIKPSRSFVGREVNPLGAIFIRPISKDQLELVIWGSNPSMLFQAARLAPLITGAGQPDWVVLDRSAAWRGLDGAALGYFDYKWDVVEGSSWFSLKAERPRTEPEVDGRSIC